MLINIINNKTIILSQLTPDVEQTIKYHFSAKDPKAYYHRNTHWDGWIRRYNPKTSELALPYLDELKKCCIQHNVPYEINDQRPSPRILPPNPNSITKNLLEGITLEDYQIDAIKACCTHEIGQIMACTGAGKTEIMCGIIKAYHCDTVIITEQLVILNQIVDRLKLRNVVKDDDIGLFCQGHQPEGNQVIVGSIQSLSTPSPPNEPTINNKITQKTLEKWLTTPEEHEQKLKTIFTANQIEKISQNNYKPTKFDLEVTKQYIIETRKQIEHKTYQTRCQNSRKIQEQIAKTDLILIDESDQATTPQYAKLFKNVYNGRRRYGFSGTPFHNNEPIKNLTLRENLGNIIYQIPRSHVQERNRIIPLKIWFTTVGDPRKRNDSRAYDIALKEDIIDNQEFHQITANLANKLPGKTLILIDTSPIGPLGLGLEKQINNSKFIYGQTNQKDRNKYIKSFEEGELKCLIGSKILERGFDLKNGVHNLIVIGGGAKWHKFDQRLGRAVRLNEQGHAKVFSFIHLTNKYLYKHSRERLKAAISLGYPVKVITGDKVINGEELIKSKFKLIWN